MALYRGRHTGMAVHAVQNDGSWATIREFLEEIDLDHVPFGGYPPVVRDLDGSLTIWGSKEPVVVNDWLFVISGRRLYGFADEDFTKIFERTDGE